MGLIHALKLWRHYLLGSEIKAYTDHNSLIHFSKQPNLTGRQARWSEFLQSYDVEIIYKPGASNIVADALSRRPDLKINNISVLNQVDMSLYKNYADCTSFKEVFHALTVPQDPCPKKLEAKLPRYRITDDLLYFDDRLCVPSVPSSLRSNLLREHHDITIGAHNGANKVYMALRDKFYWPKLHRDIVRYTSSCDDCQHNKPKRSTAGVASPMPVPTKRWHTISMDFFTKLPKTANGYTAVFVVVDRLTKLAHFIPTFDTATAVDIANLFFTHCFKLHGLPEVIISDHDPKFTSIFWSSLFKILGTKFNMSSANHPQTDGQSERTIQILEQYLRTVVNYAQDDWDQHLAAFEFAYNKYYTSSTGMSPFMLTYGLDPLVPSDFLNLDRTKSDTPTVEAFLDKMCTLTQLAVDKLRDAQDLQRAYADNTRKPELFSTDDLVLIPTAHLLRDNIAQRPNTSLRQKYVGPFKIIEVLSPVTVRVQLPATIKSHPVLHVSLLKKYVSPEKGGRTVQPRPHPELVNDFVSYEVEAIVDVRTRYRKKEYLVKWKEFKHHDNSWLPESNLEHCADLIKQFYYKQNSTQLPHPHTPPISPLAKATKELGKFVSPHPQITPSPHSKSLSSLNPAKLNFATPVKALPPDVVHMVDSTAADSKGGGTSVASRATLSKKGDSVTKPAVALPPIVTRAGRAIRRPTRIDL